MLDPQSFQPAGPVFPSGHTCQQWSRKLSAFSVPKDREKERDILQGFSSRCWKTSKDEVAETAPAVLAAFPAAAATIPLHPTPLSIIPTFSLPTVVRWDSDSGFGIVAPANTARRKEGLREGSCRGNSSPPTTPTAHQSKPKLLHHQHTPSKLLHPLSFATPQWHPSSRQASVHEL